MFPQKQSPHFLPKTRGHDNKVNSNDNPIGGGVNHRVDSGLKFAQAYPEIYGGLHEMKETYEANETCFIKLPGHEKLFRGRVAGWFNDEGVTGAYYIIKLDNFTWPHFEIRDASLMSPVGDAILPDVKQIFNPDLRTPVPPPPSPPS